MTTLVTGGLNDNPTSNLDRMFRACESTPVNLSMVGRPARYSAPPLIRQIESGACGLKVHEDYAGYPVLLNALTVNAKRAVKLLALRATAPLPFSA
jgi:urease subunit alpha